MIPALNRLWRLFSTQGKRATAPARLQVEQLEDRTVPAMLDLTTQGAIGSINNAIFRQFEVQPAGSGVIDAFVRIQSIKGGVEQGYNSDHRSVQFDENKSPIFTRSLLLSAVPVVDIGGVNYREFLLDINQKASQPLLSLDELRIYMGNAPDLSGYDPATQTLAGLNATYDLDAGGGNWIKLNANLNQGIGKANMLAYIPASDFTGGSYVYLYSKFGVNEAPTGGFEQWAAGESTTTAATGSISGTVINQATGAGVAGVLVYLGPDIFTYTDANGNYSFNELATALGSYTVYDVTVAPPADSTTGTSVIDVSLQSSGQSVTGVDFYLTFGTINPPPGRA